MTWNNMSCHHIIIIVWIVKSWITFLSQHAMTKLYVVKKINLFFLDFVDKNVLTPFKHDVHVIVFTMMYILKIAFVQDTLKHASIKDWTQYLMETCSYIHHDVYFKSCICTKYIKAYILKDWTQDLIVTHYRLNHQTNSTHYYKDEFLKLYHV